MKRMMPTTQRMPAIGRVIAVNLSVVVFAFLAVEEAMVLPQ
jgi:hypothetical protein